MSAVRAWKWKWSNGVEKSEIDLDWMMKAFTSNTFVDLIRSQVLLNLNVEPKGKAKDSKGIETWDHNDAHLDV